MSDDSDSAAKNVAEKKKYDFQVKIVMVGDVGAGKTSFLNRYIDDKFIDEDNTAVPAEFVRLVRKEKFIDYHGKTIRAQLWDPAGQEKFRAITSSFFKKADGVMLCFPLDDAEKFSNLINWQDEILKYAESNVDKKIVGMKCDMPGRSVTADQITKLASEMNAPWIETSSKDGTNVHRCVQDFIDLIMERKVGAPKVAPDVKSPAPATTNGTASPQNPGMVGGLNKEPTKSTKEKEGCCSLQ